MNYQWTVGFYEKRGGGRFKSAGFMILGIVLKFRRL